MSATPLFDALAGKATAGRPGVRELDVALARTLMRLDPGTPDAVLAAAILASHAVSAGHAGFPLAAPRTVLDLELPWPDARPWQKALRASRWVAVPEDAEVPTPPDAPLVLENGLVYLRRYREYERRLAGELRRLAAARARGGSPGQLQGLFTRLFPPGQRDESQARAAALALRHALLLLTGGPGTGKTTTITRLLVLLVEQARLAGDAPPRIALAAPTGRAAERMAESVRLAVQSLRAAGVDGALLDALPTGASTLHRLLGTLPGTPRFRHHADDPLPFDIVVVDEASMVDLPLMARLVDALAEGTRLILIGDPDQLPSVEAGDVLAGIVRAAGAGRLDPADARALEPLLRDLPPDAVAGSDDARFGGCRVHLQRAWRQADTLQLAPLAEAARSGDADTALALLRRGGLAGVRFHEDLADPLRLQGDGPLAHWRALAQASGPAEALAMANRVRLLTAVHEGPQGARRLNARIAGLLTGGNARADGHFHGQPILITENSYRHGLFNGDTGICFEGPDGHLMAWFPGSDPEHPRVFHPATLPAHDSAFAMTVHKAQGSEFDCVWLLLSAHPNRVLSRELLYTGLTRARKELHLAASEAILREALGRHASRLSGLAWRLGASTS